MFSFVKQFIEKIFQSYNFSYIHLCCWHPANNGMGLRIWLINDTEYQTVVSFRAQRGTWVRCIIRFLASLGMTHLLGFQHGIALGQLL